MDDAADIIPLLACSDIAGEHDFLVKVLDFDSGGVERTPDGAVVARGGASRWQAGLAAPS